MAFFNPIRRDKRSGKITMALYRIAQAIDFLFRERGKEERLYPTQIQSLFFLKYARPGVRTVGGLAERLKVTYATSSDVARALERKGLVIRAPSSEDRRVITLQLTESGEEKTKTLENLLDEVEAAVESLPAEEQEVLLHATQTIVRRLQNASYVRVYEMCWNCQFFQKDAHPNDPRGPHHCTFVDAPLPEPHTYWECPDFVPAENERRDETCSIS